MDSTSELGKTIDHHRTFWRLQRFGWACMLLVIVAALAGLFSNGPLARVEAAGDGLGLYYSRFGRMSAGTTLKIVVEPPHDSERVSVWILRPYLSRFAVSGVLPEPVSAAGSGDEILYSFATDPSKTLHVSMRLTANEGSFGRIAGRIRTSRATLEFSQFFWP